MKEYIIFKSTSITFKTTTQQKKKKTKAIVCFWREIYFKIYVILLGKVDNFRETQDAEVESIRADSNSKSQWSSQPLKKTRQTLKVKMIMNNFMSSVIWLNLREICSIFLFSEHIYDLSSLKNIMSYSTNKSTANRYVASQIEGKLCIWSCHTEDKHSEYVCKILLHSSSKLTCTWGLLHRISTVDGSI